MQCKVLLMFLMLCTQVLGAELKFYAYEDFMASSLFSWDQLKHFHEQTLRALYEEEFVLERKTLIDKAFSHNYEHFAAHNSTVGVLVSSIGDTKALEGVITVLNDPSIPVIIQIVANQTEGYGKMLEQLLQRFPDATGFQLVLPNENHLVKLFDAKAQSGVIERALPPAQAAPQEYQDKITCFTLQRAFMHKLVEELPAIMHFLSQKHAVSCVQ